MTGGNGQGERCTHFEGSRRLLGTFGGRHELVLNLEAPQSVEMGWRPALLQVMVCLQSRLHNVYNTVSMLEQISEQIRGKVT